MRTCHLNETMFYILLRSLGPFLRIYFLPLKPADSKLYFKETVESIFFSVKSLILYLTNKQVTGQYIVLQHFL